MNWLMKSPHIMVLVLGFLLVIYRFGWEWYCERMISKAIRKTIRKVIFETFFIILAILFWIMLDNEVKTYPEAEAISFTFGILVTLALGSLTSILFKIANSDYVGLANICPKEGRLNILCRKIVVEPLKGGGPLIGYLERALYFIALLYNPIFIGGILTFKIAAKWESWRNITQVPQKLDAFSTDIDYFTFRRRWSSKLYSRFLVGTFSNILFAIIGWGFYHWFMMVLAP